MSKTVEELAQETNKNIESYKNEVKALREELENAVTKEDVSNVEKKIEGLATSETVNGLDELVKELQEDLQVVKEGGVASQKQLENKVGEFLKENHDKIKSIQAQGHGVVEFTVKAVDNMTTGSATNPDGIPELVGVQVAPPTNVNLRDTFVEQLTTNVSTSLAAYPYTESVPKDGDYAFVAEGAVKPQTDFKIETRYAQPVKIAAWVKLTDEAVQDITGLQSIATDYLRKKHDLKKQNGLLFGDGISPNPKGATEYARAFVAGDMLNAVDSPNFLDVINAAATDIYTTYNYEDEMSYMPSLVVINPVDFYLQLVSAKDGDGRPLYPTASLFNRVNIGGMTIIPDRAIPAGKIFVCDMSKYNTTRYMDYTVKIGWVNDDFIRNQFVILGESRFHAFVKKLDEQAFIYDDIDAIKNKIDADETASI